MSEHEQNACAMWTHSASFLCQSFHSDPLFQKLFVFHCYAFCQSNLEQRFLGVSASLRCLSASLRLFKLSSRCSGVSTFLYCLSASMGFLKRSSLAHESAMFQLNNS